MREGEVNILEIWIWSMEGWCKYRWHQKILLSITLFQAEVYGSEDVFGKDVLKGVEIIDSTEILHDIDGMSCSFKHPCTTFPEKNFEDWDCGFICGKMILKK